MMSDTVCQRTFGLSLHESPADFTDDRDELLDVGKAGFGDNLSENENSLQSSLPRSDHLSVRCKYDQFVNIRSCIWGAPSPKFSG